MFMELAVEPCFLGVIDIPFMEEFGPDMFIPGMDPEEE
jgi:hypothetical protein